MSRPAAKPLAFMALCECSACSESAVISVRLDHKSGWNGTMGDFCATARTMPAGWVAFKWFQVSVEAYLCPKHAGIFWLVKLAAFKESPTRKLDNARTYRRFRS